jgi:hypothetical protein
MKCWELLSHPARAKPMGLRTRLRSLAKGTLVSSFKSCGNCDACNVHRPDNLSIHGSRQTKWPPCVVCERVRSLVESTQTAGIVADDIAGTNRCLPMEFGRRIYSANCHSSMSINARHMRVLRAALFRIYMLTIGRGLV